MNIEEIRKLFPYLNNGIIYFNHASTGPVCTPVINKINQVLKERSESKPDEYSVFITVVHETMELLAGYLNTEKDRIAFTDNTTNGINILAQGLDWQKGDRIILNDIEFPANVYPYLNLKKKGVEVHFVKSEDGIVTAENLIDAADERTKLISVSYVQFLSGYKIDLEKLGSFCRSRNIILAVDAIQGLGAMHLDVTKCKIDFLSCGVQKWMLGLQGMAFIYISKQLQETMHPAYVGWLSVENAWDLLKFNMELKTLASAFQTGTINTLGIYALNTIMKIFNEFGVNRIENLVVDNSLFLRNKLKEAGFRVHPQELEEICFSGIVSFRHPDSEGLFNWLTERKILVSLREGLIRLSPHFYNTEEDLDKVIDAIRNY